MADVGAGGASAVTVGDGVAVKVGTGVVVAVGTGVLVAVGRGVAVAGVVGFRISDVERGEAATTAAGATGSTVGLGTTVEEGKVARGEAPAGNVVRPAPGGEAGDVRTNGVAESNPADIAMGDALAFGSAVPPLAK